MATLDWSMTLAGWPAHRLRPVKVVGCSHMSTWAALQFAYAIGLAEGFLLASHVQPHIDGVPEGEPVRVQLPLLFTEQKVVASEGVAQGELVYVPAGPDMPLPPRDRPIMAWAEDQGRPWFRVVENEHTLIGGLDDAQLARLVAWFLGQRPVEGTWTEALPSPQAARILVGGLFTHGWSRNLLLVKPGRRTTVTLWAGMHNGCRLPRSGLPLPTAAAFGLRAVRDGGRWDLEDVDEDTTCPLRDDNGRLIRPTAV